MIHGIVKELEAVEDLDSATALDTNQAPEHAEGWSSDAVGGGGAGNGGGLGVLGLGLHPSVVIGDVDDHQWMELEGQAAARRGSH